MSVLADGVVEVDDIVFGGAAVTPTRLEVATNLSRLTAAGATTQLAVTAEFANAPQADVSAAATGTDYRSSNPAIATVSPEGLVTAVASGTVLVSALNDGALGVLRIEVVLGGDSDGDGLPDDWELANGFDPNDPIDAMDDADNDGLTTGQEFAAGTNARDSDTDDDGLLDGPEVTAFGTNPLLFDTDGDGLSDGLEVLTGSDPLDPNSYSLSAALRSLSVSPQDFTITFNTILGEASRQLLVQGLLRDGTTIDLTSRTRGTAYQSSDLTVCNFGARDGEIFAGRDATCTITIRNSGFAATAAAAVRSFSPSALGYMELPGYANDVDVSGSHVFVAAGAAGLVVVDVSDRTAPRVVATLDTAGNANDVLVVGTRAYLADGANGLLIVDVAEPTRPALLATLDTPGIAQDLAVSGDLVLVVDGGVALHVIDASDPSAPRLLATAATPGVLAVAANAASGLAVVADGSGIRVVDLATPASPRILGGIGTGSALDVVLRGSMAIVAAYTSSLVVVDVSTPSAPVVRGTTLGSAGAGYLVDLDVEGALALGADILFANAVPIADVSDPAAPQPRAAVDFSELRWDVGIAIAADSNWFYLTAGTLRIENGTVGSTRLYIGQYLAVEDTAGTPPTIAITAPAPGAVVTEGSVLVITASAKDDVAVSRVDFFVDGEVVFRDTAAPYRYTFTVPAGRTALRIEANAVDLGGSTRAATPVDVVVAREGVTAAAATVLDESGAPVEGAYCVVNRGGTELADAAGSVLIPNVRTDRGAIIVLVSATIAGREFRGASAALPPVVGGVTDVGTIIVHPVIPIFPAPRSATSSLPTVHDSADINGDGILDVVVGGFQAISIHLGRGDGTFRSPSEIRLATVVAGVSLVDLDLDGVADLVASLSVLNEIAVLINLGDGSFAPARRYTAGNGPASISAADFNGDGIADVAVANRSSREVLVFPGTGGGELGVPTVATRLSAGGDPRTLASGDINGDGKADLVLGGGGVGLLLGNGDGTFQPRQDVDTANLYWFVTTGDLNGDGRDDIAGGFQNPISRSTGLRLLLGRADGILAAGANVAVSSGLEAIAGEIIDTDLDGLNDIVYVTGRNNATGGSGTTLSYLQVSLGNGSGGVVGCRFTGDSTCPRTPIAVGPTSLAVGDFDLDGVTDASVLDQQAGFTMHLGHGDGSFDSFRRQLIPGGAFLLSTQLETLELFDLDRDGNLDLAGCAWNGMVFFAWGSPGGLFGGVSGQADSSGLCNTGFRTADANGDGHRDLVALAQSSPSGRLSVLIGDGARRFGPPLTLPVGVRPASVAVADFNGDGSPDLAAANQGSNDVSVLLGTLGGFLPERRFAVGSAPRAIRTADLDLDGRADLVVANSLTSTLSVLFGAGDGTFTPAQTLALLGIASSLETEDLNFDGRADIVVTTSNTVGVPMPMQVSVFLSREQRTFQAASPYPVGLSLRGDRSVFLAIADLNDDLILDLAATSFGGGVGVLLGRGDGTFGPEQQYLIHGLAGDLAVADFDGNGRADLSAVALGEDGSAFITFLPHR